MVKSMITGDKIPGPRNFLYLQGRLRAAQSRGQTFSVDHAHDTTVSDYRAHRGDGSQVILHHHSDLTPAILLQRQHLGGEAQ